MRPLPRAVPLALACLLGLSGCGDKAPSAPPSDASPAAGPAAGPSVPPGTLPSGVGEAVSARLKEAVEARMRQGGAPRLPTGFEPLKTSDVELYLSLAPQMQKVAGDISAVTKLASEHGLSATQWVTIQARVTGTALALKMGNVPDPLKGDVAVVTPYQERILNAMRGR